MPLSRPITLTDVLQMARAHPDRKNPTDNPPDNLPEWANCYYFAADGTPGCIIGNVIASLGGSPEDVVEGRGCREHTDLFASVADALDAARVQTVADKEGMTWGQAAEVEPVWSTAEQD